MYGRVACGTGIVQSRSCDGDEINALARFLSPRLNDVMARNYHDAVCCTISRTEMKAICEGEAATIFVCLGCGEEWRGGCEKIQ